MSHRSIVDADESALCTHHSRRRFLALSAAAASAAGLVTAAPGITQAVAPASRIDPAFVRLARFLTGRNDLDARIIARAYDALATANPSFAAHSIALARAIEDARLADVNALAISPLYADPGDRAVAIAIVSAFYLGQVGEGSKARFVAFEKALMFEPTADMVPIPTYSRGGPGYWGKVTQVPND
jgi:fructose 5-dehydrogenase small subunit